LTARTIRVVLGGLPGLISFMYSTCIFCTQPLGTNELIERFPLGRRLAFDAAKGRLWVVCRKCERWNLTPMEDRWEAIEQCEREFASTRIRTSTDNIGLAKFSEGLVLIRIGNPMRPEFAAWRYGDQFGRRRKRAILYTAGATVGLGAVMAGMAAAGVGAAFFPHIGGLLNHRTAAKFKTTDGRQLVVRYEHLPKARIEPARVQGWRLHVKHKKGTDTFEDEEAARVAGILMPKVNNYGGNKDVVQRAVADIEAAGHPDRYLANTLRGIAAPGHAKRAVKKRSALQQLPKPAKLAVEMALHEEQERRALEGELAILEAAWREAEEIAGIADNLLVPSKDEEFIAQHRPAQQPTRDG
jgi:hypothetical protein